MGSGGRPTKAGEVSKLAGVIGHCTHNPVRGNLPGSVQNSEECVQENPSDIWLIEDIHLQ